MQATGSGDHGSNTGTQPGGTYDGRGGGVQVIPKDAIALFEGQPLAALEHVIVVPLE